jgi:effector-binding domain-containing protein
MSQHVEIQRRDEQPYLGIRERVAMDGIAAAVDRAIPELFGWLGEHGVVPAAVPFIRYLVIDMAAGLELEIGVPAVAQAGDDGRIRPGVLPAGRYVVLRHVGPYDGLLASNAELQDWAQRQGVTLEGQETPQGTAFRSRVEHYLTNPAEEPDPAKSEVDVAYLISES